LLKDISSLFVVGNELKGFITMTPGQLSFPAMQLDVQSVEDFASDGRGPASVAGEAGHVCSREGRS